MDTDTEGTLYQINCFNAGDADSGKRLDVFLSDENPGLSRSHIQKLVTVGMVEVNGVTSRPSYKIKSGDAVLLRIPPPVELVVEPEPIPLDILYEDSHLVVVNKPRGMVVHPAEGNYSGTLVNALLHHCRDLSGINGVMRPGIVHRLDKDTSGLLMVAKNDAAHLDLARQISDRKVEKRYLALAYGSLKHNLGTVDAPIGRHPRDRQRMAVEPRNGKQAVTHYRVISRHGSYIYLDLRLETGRTHQIRVHLAYIGCPIVGDPKYGPDKGNPFDLEGQFLHAALLSFAHPRSQEKMVFEAPLPGELKKVLDRVRLS